MTKSTIEAIRSICAADSSVKQESVERAIRVLCGRDKICDEPLDRAFSRREVAEALGITPHEVGKIARRGLLVPVRTSKQRVRRFTGASVRALLNGTATTTTTTTTTSKPEGK